MAMLQIPSLGILTQYTVRLPSVRILFYYFRLSFMQKVVVLPCRVSDSLPPLGALRVHLLAEGLLMNLITKRIIKLPSRPENHGNRVARAQQGK